MCFEWIYNNRDLMETVWIEWGVFQYFCFWQRIFFFDDIKCRINFLTDYKNKFLDNIPKKGDQF